MNTYPDFPYSEQFAISANHPGSGYQIKLVDSGGASLVKWKPGMRLDFRDIRFSDGAGRKIPYWIESKTDGVGAIVWIKTTSSKIIYLRWGNGSAVSESNIDAVMELGDEFSGTSLNSSKWTSGITGTYTNAGVSVANGECRLQIDDGIEQNVYIKSVKTFQNDVIIAIKRKSADTQYMVQSLAAGAPYASNLHQCLVANGYSATYFDTNSGKISKNAVSLVTANHTLSTGDYHVHEFVYTADGTLIYKTDSTQRGTTQDTTYLSNNKYVYISQGSFSTAGSGADTYIDYVFVKKYLGTEPTLTKISSGYTFPLERIAHLLESGTTPENISKPFSSSNDILLAKVFSQHNKIIIEKPFSSNSDVQIQKLFSQYNAINISKIYASSNDIIEILQKSFTSNSDIQVSKFFSQHNKIIIEKAFSSENDIIAPVSKAFSSASDILLQKPFYSGSDIQVWKVFSSESDINAILSKVFSSTSDIQVLKAFSSSSDVRVSKIFASSSDIIIVITSTDFDFPLILIITQNTRTATITQNSRTVTFN